MSNTKKTSVLPKSLSGAELKQWLKSNARSIAMHDKRTFYTEEEMEERRKELSDIFIHLKKLKDTKALVAERLREGNDDELLVTIPSTRGVKSLTKTAEEIAGELEKGYYDECFDVYAIPNEIDYTMDYYDEFGNLIEDRVRPLSQKEIFNFFGGLFNAQKLG